MYDGKRLLLNRYPEAHGLKEGEPGGIWSLQKSDAGWGNPIFLIKDGMRATIIDATRPGGKGQGDLYMCFRLADGTWSQAFNLTLLNTEDLDWCPTVSPDGKYLFFSRNRTGNGDIYWVDMKIVENLRPKESKLKE